MSTITYQWISLFLTYAPVKLRCPHPPGNPGDITFFVTPVFLSLLILPFPTLINHFIPFIFYCSAFFSRHFPVHTLFYHTLFFKPRSCSGRGMGAKQFDRHIISPGLIFWILRYLRGHSQRTSG